MSTSADLFHNLESSKMYRDYARAWQTATGMILRFVQAEDLPVADTGAPKHSFCSMLGGQFHSCPACLDFQTHLTGEATEKPHVSRCSFGLSEMAVPVRFGHETIGFLLSGQVLPTQPSEAEFARIKAHLEATSITTIDFDLLRKAYFATPVIPPKVQRAHAKLLVDFAEHLGVMANQIVIAENHREPPILTRAKNYIREHLDVDMSLAELAQGVSTSRFYLCKLFKRYTGATFTEYRARCRVERAKVLLLEPNRRIIEVAYEAGFQSLTHFNRTFRRFAGESPTDFRLHLNEQQDTASDHRKVASWNHKELFRIVA